MAKAIIKNAFIDKNTGAFYKVGASVNFEDDRAREIIKAGDYIELIDEPIAAPKKARKKKV